MKPAPCEAETRSCTDDKPIKLTVDLPGAIHRDLAAYAELLGKETAQAAIEPAKLIDR